MFRKSFCGKSSYSAFHSYFWMVNKKTLEERAKKTAGLQDIRPEDAAFFEQFKGGGYKDSWMYHTQTGRDTGEHGLGLYNEYAVVGLFERRVDRRLHFVVNPVGTPSIEALDTLCRRL